MSHARKRNQFGATTLRLLVGTLFVAGMLVTTVAASAAQGLPGLPVDGEGDDWTVPRDVCLAVFPDGIIVGDPVVGDVDCSLIFGAPPTEEPTEVPTQKPTEVPTQEPTQSPDHDHHKKHDHDKKHETDTGGKKAPVVTTMPSTGHGVESTGNGTTAILGAMALILAALAGVTLRLTGARNLRR